MQGRRRVKTDAIDLEAITELVLAGHGVPVTARSARVIELAAWAMHRSRRVQTRTATKNQLLAQLDRCFPGLALALPDVLGTQVGRLVAAEFADPHRLAALGVTRFVRFAANRGLRVRRSAAERLVAAARTTLPAPAAVVARQVLADDQALLANLDAQSRPRKPRWPGCCRRRFASLITVPAGARSGPATTAPRSAIHSDGPVPASSTTHPACPRPNTSRPGSVVTATSAERAARLCGVR